MCRSKKGTRFSKAKCTRFIVVVKKYHKPPSNWGNALKADLVLLDGKIVTMNPLQPSAEAVAVKRDQILKVGSTEMISELIGKKTKKIHLKGKTVIPGIIDTHIHVADFGRILSWLDLENVQSVEEAKQCLAQYAKKTAKGKWIIGRGWNQERFTEKRFLTRFDLDDVSAKNPVVLYHESGQVCVINSRAAELAGMAKQQPTDVETDKNKFNGILRDESTNQVWNLIPQPTEDELVAQAALACEKIVEAGITSIHWIVLSPMEVSVIQTLNRQNKLPLRVSVIVPASLLDKVSSSNLNSEMLKFKGAEVFADGYLAAETAALIEPYSDNPGEQGKLLCSKEEMAKTADKILDRGLQLVVHAVGDKAVDLALRIVEQVKAGKAEKASRYRVEQAAVLNQELIERMKKNKVIVSIQPRVIASEFSVWSATKRLGATRASWLFPVKTLVEKGIQVIAGSDCPMEPLNPLLGIKEAVTREAFPEHRLSTEDALRMYTVYAAFSTFEENIKGTIQESKLADLTVLSGDLLSASPNEITQLNVEMTIIGGRIIYQKSPS